jgi:NAD(P)H-flavin reductase
VRYADDLAKFRFSISSSTGAAGVKIRPGQAIVLDFMDWMGPPQYQHMANSAPGSINDDRVRTWTVSSAHEGQEVNWFELTMRKMNQGAVTGALFNILDNYQQGTWGIPLHIDTNVAADVVGITGDFYLGQDDVKAFWVAGGIGVTPFLSMLSALSNRSTHEHTDVVLALATREPESMLKILAKAMPSGAKNLDIRVDLFITTDLIDMERWGGSLPCVWIHKGRISTEYLVNTVGDRDVLICGPGAFGDAVVADLATAGVSDDKIRREGFY